MTILSMITLTGKLILHVDMKELKGATSLIDIALRRPRLHCLRTTIAWTKVLFPVNIDQASTKPRIMDWQMVTISWICTHELTSEHGVMPKRESSVRFREVAVHAHQVGDGVLGFLDHQSVDAYTK